MPRTVADPLLRRRLVAERLGIELPPSLQADEAPWHTTVCSRLGRDLIARQPSIAMIFRFIEQAMQHGQRSLIVRDTAAHRWADRACELLGADAVRMAVATAVPEKTPRWLPIELNEHVCRDRLAIELADRVDATFVRPRGKIMRLLCQRLESARSPTVQVLVTDAKDQAAQQLISRGAIGYWTKQDSAAPATCAVQTSTHAAATSMAVESLVHHPERWLIHSTRTRTGAWPSESPTQFDDWLLLSPPTKRLTSPLETLSRIVADRRLVGAQRTTSADHPVVCFTDLPLLEWLERRTFRPHLGRWDAEPYGVAIDRGAAKRLGIQPVIYGDQQRRSALSESERWRFQAVGKTFDWTRENEWRGRGLIELSRFAADELVVFVKRRDERARLAHSPWPVVDVESLTKVSAINEVG